MSDPASANLFDPSRPEFQVNPYPFYCRLRTEAPIYWNASNQAWVMTRYADVGAVLRDRRFLTQKTFFPGGQFTAMQEIMRRWMLLSDPPAHTRMRGLVNKAFTPHMVRACDGTSKRSLGACSIRSRWPGRWTSSGIWPFPCPSP